MASSFVLIACYFRLQLPSDHVPPEVPGNRVERVRQCIRALLCKLAAAVQDEFGFR